MIALPRSSTAEVRNPILGLPTARAIADQVDGQALELLARLLTELGDDCADRAKKAWRTHKAPMACYWKICAVYSRHIARAMRSLTRARQAAEAGQAAARLNA
jgi:hypothetical protein